VHLNRVIRAQDLNVLYIAGPGHADPGWSPIPTGRQLHRALPEDRAGHQRHQRIVQAILLALRHSQPRGTGNPGSIHEGGELGYALTHAYGAVFDNPDLIAACVIGDGEAETGPLAASWHSNKFLNPARDGAVLPILHLNGYKIANPTVLARISREELTDLLRGYGHDPVFVEGNEPAAMHQAFAAALDHAIYSIAQIQRKARDAEAHAPMRPRWPMIVLVSPKGGPGQKWSTGCR